MKTEKNTYGDPVFDAKFRMEMSVLQINNGQDFYGELLIASFVVIANELTEENSISAFAGFPDPDNPGRMQAVTCIANFNPKEGFADDRMVMNYYGSTSRAEFEDHSAWAEEGPFNEDTSPDTEKDAYESFVR